MRLLLNKPLFSALTIVIGISSIWWSYQERAPGEDFVKNEGRLQNTTTTETPTSMPTTNYEMPPSVSPTAMEQQTSKPSVSPTAIEQHTFKPSVSPTAIEQQTFKPSVSPTAMEEHTSEPSLEGTDWMLEHLILQNETMKEMTALETMIPDFYSFANDNRTSLLTVEEVKQQMLHLIRGKGLILIGDSTTRVLFGFLWCLINTIDDVAIPDSIHGCNNLQTQLKEKEAECKDGDNNNCIATFPHRPNETLHLQFISKYHLAEDDGFSKSLKESLVDGRVIFLGMPCLHSLWSPGSREHGIRDPNCTMAPNLFQTYFDSIHSATQNQTVKLLLGTTVALCDSKLGNEKDLIDAYLRQEHFHPKKQRSQKMLDFYNHGVAQPLPLNYSGPIEVYKDFRANHTCDHAMFDATGALYCSTAGLKALLDHPLSSRMTVIDIHGATFDGCDSTVDGRHYVMGPPLLRQLSLLLQASNSSDMSEQ